ncbi:MAG: translocation/assembly module TamB domain-containing protein, partial [Desulforhopalus sp.]|nr:translocation/assembly module TamB domain-containing protein [Desulforhopalus sp.]
MIRKTLLGLVLLLMVLSVILIGFFGGTEQGLQLLGRLTNHLAGEQVRIGRLDGRLLGAWSASDLEFTDPAVEVRVDRLQWSWQPFSLLQGNLLLDHFRLDGVDVQLLPARADAPAADDEAASGRPVIPPLVVELRELAVNDFRLFGDDDEPLLQIDQLRADLQLDREKLTINAFRLDGPDIGLSIAGTLELDGEPQLQVGGNLRFAGYGFHPLAGGYRLSGPLAALQVNLSLTQPGLIRVSGTLAELFGDPVWNARLHAEEIDLASLIVHCPAILLQRVDADMSGTFATYGGRVRASGVWQGFDHLELDAELAGDGMGIDFPALALRRGTGQAVAEGASINWRELFAWAGRFSFTAIDLSPIAAELAGPFDAELTSRGDVYDDRLEAIFAFDSLSGPFYGYPLEAAGEISLDLEGVATDNLRLAFAQSPGALMVDRGQFRWSTEPTWLAEMRLVDFQPAFFSPLLDGRISGHFFSEGRLAEAEADGVLRIEQLSGELAGHRLAGLGVLRFAGEKLVAENLELQSGTTELSLNGELAEQLSLNFALSSPDIGGVLPESGGSLHLEGALWGSRQEPRLTVSARGDDLWHHHSALGQLRAEGTAGLAPDDPLALSLTITGLAAGGVAVDHAGLEVDGTLKNHQASMTVLGPLGRLALAADGGYAGEWLGKIFAIELASEGYGLWRQEGDAALKAGTSGVELSSLCLQAAEGRICSGGEVSFGENPAWSAEAAGEALPLALLNSSGLLALPLTGRLDADLAIAGQAGVLDRGSANLAVKRFTVEMADDLEVDSQLRDITLQMELIDRRLGIDLASQVKGGGSLQLAAELVGLAEISPAVAELPLTGKLTIDAFNPALLAVLAKYEAIPSGVLSGQFSLFGTPRQPRVSGNLQLADGKVAIPSLGIELADIHCTLAADRAGMRLGGGLSSGSGTLAAEGMLYYEPEGVSADIRLRGEDVLAVDLPEYRFQLSPDLRLLFADNRLEVRGLVEVPYGLIIPEEFQESIAPSADVVMVNGEEIEETSSLAENIILDVDVRLTDEVRIDGHGLTGRLAGELNVRTTTSNLLVGRGELDLLEGTFTVYGRSLDIARGRVLFTGGPIDNPGVDVRAQKSVGEGQAREQAYTVGMEITGLLQDLQFRLFSEPFMEDTEILSLMIVGHSFAESSTEE